MTDRYENIRRALEAMQASARGHRHKRDLAHMDFREACAPDTIRALLAERDALRAERDELAEQLRLATIAEALAEAEANDAAIDQARGEGEP